MPGTFSPPPRVSDPDMHHGTCVTHVPWCMLGSLTSGFLWSRWREKRSQHSQRINNPQFQVSGNRPIHRSCSFVPTTIHRCWILYESATMWPWICLWYMANAHVCRGMSLWLHTEMSHILVYEDAFGSKFRFLLWIMYSHLPSLNTELSKLKISTCAVEYF